mmetsp:Transcript_29675/g.83697  ORF Transcript_29675/g.83697 Transcript_29675/m.83697 type:complete len:358 (-) Transcript_29675:468-1541(-)
MRPSDAPTLCPPRHGRLLRGGPRPRGPTRPSGRRHQALLQHGAHLRDALAHRLLRHRQLRDAVTDAEPAAFARATCPLHVEGEQAALLECRQAAADLLLRSQVDGLVQALAELPVAGVDVQELDRLLAGPREGAQQYLLPHGQLLHDLERVAPLVLQGPLRRCLHGCARHCLRCLGRGTAGGRRRVGVRDRSGHVPGGRLRWQQRRRRGLRRGLRQAMGGVRVAKDLLAEIHDLAAVATVLGDLPYAQLQRGPPQCLQLGGAVRASGRELRLRDLAELLHGVRLEEERLAGVRGRGDQDSLEQVHRVRDGDHGEPRRSGARRQGEEGLERVAAAVLVAALPLRPLHELVHLVCDHHN